MAFYVFNLWISSYAYIEKQQQIHHFISIVCALQLRRPD